MSDLDWKDEKKDRKKEEVVKEDENEGLPEGLGVSSALGAFFKQDKFCDVTFVLRDEKDSKSGEAAKIGAHKIILAARSPVFEAMLFPSFEAQKKEDLKEIELKGVKKGAFQAFLQAVYSGETEITPENISELSRLGKKYQVECVRRSCVDFLKTGVTIDNACLWFSRSAPSSSERTTSQRFIEDNFRKVMETDGFMDLTGADLSVLAKSGYLECEEVDLWNSVLKWVDGQVDKRIVSDSVDDRKKALREVIPYIRFPVMKMDQLISKVTPTKLLPTDHILALYNYVGSKDTSDKAKFELHYPTQERNPRKPSSFFIWDGAQAAAASTFTTYSAPVPLTVSDAGLVLSSTGSGWNTAHGICEWAPKTGVYQFEIVLESYDATNTYNVVVGLIPATGDTRLKAGGPIAYGAQAGWGFITGQGQTTQGSGSYGVSSIGGTNYTGQCRQGDRVGILYNSETGFVEFFKNGTALSGQALRCTGSVRPAVSCVMTQRLRLNFKCRLVSSRS